MRMMHSVDSAGSLPDGGAAARARLGSGEEHSELDAYEGPRYWRGRGESEGGCSVQVLVHCAYSLPHMSHLHLGAMPSFDGAVHAYVEVFIVHTINNREVLKQTHSPDDFGCSVVKSRNPTWDYTVEQTLTMPQISAIRIKVWDHHTIRKPKLVGEVDIDHADLPAADGKQTYMLELRTHRKLPEGDPPAINVTVTVNGVLPRGDSLQTN